MSIVKKVRGSVAAYAARHELDATKKTLPRSKKLISRSATARKEVARQIKFQRFKNKVLTGSSRIKSTGGSRQKEVRSQHAKMQAATRARSGATSPVRRPVIITGSSHPKVARKIATTVQMLRERSKKSPAQRPPGRHVTAKGKPPIAIPKAKHVPITFKTHEQLHRPIVLGNLRRKIMHKSGLVRAGSKFQAARSGEGSQAKRYLHYVGKRIKRTVSGVGTALKNATGIFKKATPSPQRNPQGFRRSKPKGRRNKIAASLRALRNTGAPKSAVKAVSKIGQQKLKGTGLDNSARKKSRKRKVRILKEQQRAAKKKK